MTGWARRIGVVATCLLILALAVSGGQSVGATETGTVASSGDAGPAPASATAETLVVDDSGDAPYTSVAEAVRDARDGDTVEVRPGTYAEEIVVDVNITLVAPDGATLDGASLEDGTAVLVTESASPTVEGFTVTDYEVGVLAMSDATGDWTLAGVTIRNSEWDAVRARYSRGDWTIRDSTIEDNAGRGVVADESTGDWVVESTTIRGNDGDPALNSHRGIGVDAGSSTGAWTIRESVIRGHVNGSGYGVDAAETTGDWTIQDTTIADNGHGLTAASAGGAWTVTGTTFGDNDDESIRATGTTGAWTVDESAFLDNGVPEIQATDASPAGDATGNWWGSPDGPGLEDCVGNVRCTDHLTDPPATAPVSENTSDSTPASVQFDDQSVSAEVATQAVTVASVTLSEGGYVVVYNTTDTGEPDAVVGASNFLGPGHHTNVRIAFDRTLAATQRVVAYAHRDTDGDNVFEFTGGQTDGPYTVDGDPVGDTATLQVVVDTPVPTAGSTPTPTATLTPTATPTLTVTPTPTPTPWDSPADPTVTTTEASGPGFGPTTTGLALLIGTGLVYRWRRDRS